MDVIERNYAEDLARGRSAALAVPGPRLPDDWPTDPEQAYALPRYWTEAAELPADVRARGSLSREDLWVMADQAVAGRRSWSEVMICSFAWGYAVAPYGPFRLRRILSDPENAARLEHSLRDAADLVGSDPVAAYGLLGTPPAGGGARLTWYGPAFFTRFLFVAAGPGGPARILDQVRADAVRSLTGDADLLRGSNWSPAEYAFYLGFVDGLALPTIGG